MDDLPRGEDYGTSEILVRCLNRRADDIVKVVIVPPHYVWKRNECELGVTVETMLVVQFIKDGWLVNKHDAEMILNDGFLQRNRIPVEFAGRQVQVTDTRLPSEA